MVIPTATINIIDIKVMTKPDSTIIIQALFVTEAACVVGETRVDDSKSV